MDPSLEKPTPTRDGRSLFEWLEARVTQTAANVIFNDDASGEAADLVVLTQLAGGRTAVDLYHCKAAKALPVPGKRVQDLYEVVGQAVKCAKFTMAGVLRRHLLARAAPPRAKRLLRGSVAEIQRLLADDVSVSFRVIVVQPGIGLALSTDQDALLAAAHSYLSGANITGLKVIGAAGG